MNPSSTGVISHPFLPGSQPSVIFSDRACCSITSETLNQDPNETGGILLGHYSGNTWYVIEAIDPGPNSHFTPYTFEYDTAYVNHLAKKVASLYSPHLQLLGLWHRHPGSLDRFSGTDDITNRRYALGSNYPIISCIVNLDPLFRLTAYYVPRSLVYQKIEVSFGDGMIGNNNANLRHTAPLDGSSSAVSVLDLLYLKLFALNDIPSSPLQPEIIRATDKVLFRLDSLVEFSYAIKPCGTTLQIALIQISGDERHLLEVSHGGEYGYSVVLDQNIEAIDNRPKGSLVPFSILSIINLGLAIRKDSETCASIHKEVRDLVANLLGDLNDS